MRRGNRVFEGEYTLSVQKVERPYGRDKPLPETSERYSDAQLYRILVAEALTDGAVNTKAEFDEMVHKIRNIQDADELIAFRNLRPAADLGVTVSAWSAIVAPHGRLATPIHHRVGLKANGKGW